HRRRSRYPAPSLRAKFRNLVIRELAGWSAKSSKPGSPSAANAHEFSEYQDSSESGFKSLQDLWSASDSPHKGLATVRSGGQNELLVDGVWRTRQHERPLAAVTLSIGPVPVT